MKDISVNFLCLILLRLSVSRQSLVGAAAEVGGEDLQEVDLVLHLLTGVLGRTKIMKLTCISSLKRGGGGLGKVVIERLKWRVGV